MKKTTILLLVCLIMLTNMVYAFDCQYKQMESYQVEEDRFYLDNQLLNGGPTYEYQDTSLTTARFKFYNPYDFDINIELSYKTKSSWYGDGSGGIAGIVPAKEFAIFDSNHNNGGPVSEPELKIVKPLITIKRELVTKQREICKLCAGKNCYNDGLSCGSSSECGSGYCVRGICSNSENCFDNNCRCSSNEIQCPDNKRCVTRNAVSLDTPTLCKLNEECVSGYLDPVTSLCAKSPSQIQSEKAERMRKILILVAVISFIIAGGVAIVWYLRNQNEKEKQKTEQERQKTLQKQMEVIITRLHTKNAELEKIKQELKELDMHKNAKEYALEQLNELKEKKLSLLDEVKGIEEQIDSKWKNLKPFPDKQAKNRLVIINPYLGGYKCFYNKELELKEYPVSSLVHRWVWKHKTGNWVKPGHHIHHLDGDKYNNDPDNLEEIRGEEHYEMHRQK